jgi:hypothetical protein
MVLRSTDCLTNKKQVMLITPVKLQCIALHNKIAMQLITQLNETLDSWIAALSDYDLNVLLKTPDAENWSLGQLYMHLVSESGYYRLQIEACLKSNEHAEKDINENGKVIFANNSLPDMKIKRGGELSDDLPQPVCKEEIFYKLQELKIQLNSLAKQIDVTKCSGRTRHPGLGYFNAAQWLQFTEIHMRHHFRQKRAIEDRLVAIRMNP